ncbi:helix-turn-helix domain-containing protein [Haloarchaeobius sp. DFWS5]|uniref:helix-turn-helix domain-containing protein n=1 Tax=Haloarchaeobius sp. DFWS5 TaxID=3446114 RepID=UPI003EC0D6F5
MAVIVELSIPPDAFDLGRVTAVADDIHLELERVVPTGGEVMPFFWARGTDFEEFERHVRENKLVERLTALTKVDDRILYHVVWGDTVSNLTEILSATGATILEAHGNNPWQFRLRFQDHSGLKDFHNLCREQEIEFRVERIYTLEEVEHEGFVLDLTPEQHEALVTAVERGYFGVPRGVKLADIAGDLGISQQAASERVRRGTDSVLRKVLLPRSAADLSK